MRRATLSSYLAALAVLATSGVALANPLDTYGFGSRETAMGSAATADATGFTANFYNPAGLAFAKALDLGLGYFRVDQHLAINGTDTGEDPVKGMVGGLVAPGKILGIPFAFGIATHLPDDRLSRVRTLKQDVPRWELYDNRAQILYVAANVAVRPLPWLSVGGGIMYLSSTTGSFGITGTADLKDPNNSQLRHEVDADLTSVRIPVFGARIDPDPRLSVGVTYRGQSNLDLHLDADIKGQVVDYIGKVPIYVPVEYTLSSQSFDAFHPRQVAFGTSVLPWDRLRINIDFVWTQWSAYKSATSQSTAHLSVDTMGLPLAIPPDPKPTVVIDPAFQDRLTPHVGVELIAIDASWIKVPVRAGYIFERSPVPPQIAVTNFVDADRHTMSVGVGVRFPEPIAELPGELRLDLHAAYSYLPERTTLKQNPADFTGDFRAGGHQTNIGATMGVGFLDATPSALRAVVRRRPPARGGVRDGRASCGR